MENQTPSRGGGFGTAVIIMVMSLAAGAGASYWLINRRPVAPAMSTPYQTVLLSTGAVYFGRLEGLGTPFPVLRDVFYVQSSKDPQTQQVSNALIKRGKEWHEPDRMILNAGMIVLVEPVKPTSRVAQLIEQANKQ